MQLQLLPIVGRLPRLLDSTLLPITYKRSSSSGFAAFAPLRASWRMRAEGPTSARSGSLMTGDRGDSLAHHLSKDIPQFAPNFTVYVLPPDVVCLYSEDRKFFLHGELYCALASAIGEGRKSFRELVRELEQDFPPDKIHEALKRLVDRRYVVPTSRSSAGDGGGLLGEPRSAAGDRRREISRNVACAFNRSTCRVQTELGAALSELGVRVVKRSPDLTVTLVSDYLERTTGRIEPAAFVGPYDRGCSSSPPAFFPWWGRCSAPARAPAGLVSPTA